MHGYLLRTEVTSTHIRSLLLIEGHEFHTIERPWLNNRRMKSCIPSGNYTAHPMARSASGKYRNVFHLRPVEGRTGILMHNGNLVSHSLGCLIVGSRRGKLGGKAAVLNSASAMRKLNRITGGKPFTLQILGNQVIRKAA